MKLTEHFTFGELTASDYAIRHGIANTPTDSQTLLNLHTLAEGLERCRAVLQNAPMVITSGYRSHAVNRSVGGSVNSAHMVGLAADFVVPGLNARAVCLVLQDCPEIGYDKLIYEGTWTHISFPAAGHLPRDEVFTAVFKRGGVTYVKGIQ